MGIRTTKLVQHRDEVKAAYEAGGTMGDIANLYNVSIGTVRNELITQGVTIRRRGRRKNVPTKEDAQPEFKVSSLNGLTEEVPVEAAPDVPVEALPVEHNENVESNRVIINNDESLTDIFGDN